MFILVNHQLYWKSQNCFKFSIYGQTAISNFFFLKESWLCSVKLRAPSPSPESKFQAPHLPVAKAGYQSRRPGRSVRVLGRCPGGTAVTAPARTCAGGSPGEAGCQGKPEAAAATQCLFKFGLGVTAGLSLTVPVTMIG